MSKNQIIGCNLSNIEEFVSAKGYKIDLAREICISLYRRRINSFDNMVGLPISLRRELNNEFSFNNLFPKNVQHSADGSAKYLFQNQLGDPFESAYIPGSKRNTLCVSTQSGCRMGCKFCHTGKMGFRSNLTAGEIIGQLMALQGFHSVNRIVLMGMGEPLDNILEVQKALEVLTANWGFAFGAAKITLSSIGIIPELKVIIDNRNCNVAISLHSPWSVVRKSLMPIESIHPLSEVLSFLKVNPIKKPLRLSFEYLVIDGRNNSIEDAIEVVRLLADLNSNVNVIPFNSPIIKPQTTLVAKEFQKLLNKLGQPATLRESRGFDIAAACGMMAIDS